ncbi:hypothetical protein BH11ACT8_BH11ACT8_25910 [soil metagenome]
MGDLTLHDDPAHDSAMGGLVQRLVHHRFFGEYDDHDRAVVAAQQMLERTADRLTLVRVHLDGVERGHVWLRADGDDVGVLDLTLDDHTLAPGVRDLLVERATTAGRTRLTVGVVPGDPVLGAFATGGGFDVAAYQMRLPLDDRIPAEDALVLVPMDENTFAPYMARGNEEYAEARAKAGESPERAREVAETQTAELLPDGLATAGHHFFVGEVDGERVGTLWLGTERPMAFVYDVVVDEARRREGHGAGLMRAGAVYAREQGAHALGLNVFGYNHGAKALYDRLGYSVVEEYAARTL